MARARGSRCTRTARMVRTPAVPQLPRRSARINDTSNGTTASQTVKPKLSARINEANSSRVVHNQDVRQGHQSRADRRTIIIDSGNTARAASNGSRRTTTRQPTPPVSERQDLPLEQQMGPRDAVGMSATSRHLGTGGTVTADSGACATTFSDSTPTVTPSTSFTQQNNLTQTQQTAVTTPPVQTVSHVQHVLQEPAAILQPPQQITSNPTRASGHIATTAANHLESSDPNDIDTICTAAADTSKPGHGPDNSISLSLSSASSTAAAESLGSRPPQVAALPRGTFATICEFFFLESLYQVAILAQYHETLHISGSADSSDDEGRSAGQQVVQALPSMPQGQTSPMRSPQQPLVQQQFLSVPHFTPRPARQGPYSRPHQQHPRERRGHPEHANPNWRVNVVRNDRPYYALVNQQNPNRIQMIGCYRCRDTRHGIAQCPVFAEECRRDPTRRQRCSGCDSTGFCPPSYGRRLAYEIARHPYVELNYNGRNYYVREDGPMPPWYSAELVLSRCGNRATPVVARTDQVAAVQHNNAPISRIGQPLALPSQQGPSAATANGSTAGTGGSTHVSTTAVINTVLRQVPKVNSSVGPISKLATEEMPPNLRPAEYYRPTHTRALATLDGTRCEVIVNTGADVSLVSASRLRPNRKYKPWTAEDGSVKCAGNQNLQILGRIALTVTLGPLTTRAPFVVVLGVSFFALLGVDFLYENDIAVRLAQHALLFEGHGSLVFPFPLIGQHPRHSVLCATAQGRQFRCSRDVDRRDGPRHARGSA
ncbi:hypothetical protein Emed_000008 [Eimeria media]